MCLLLAILIHLFIIFGVLYKFSFISCLQFALNSFTKLGKVLKCKYALTIKVCFYKEMYFANNSQDFRFSPWFGYII